MSRARTKIDDYLTRKLWQTDLDAVGTVRSCWLKFLRFLYVLLLELSEEQLALRAMSLVYTTLLSIVPLLAVSFSVLKAFGVHTQFEIFLYYFLEPLGEKGVDLSLKIIGFVENVKISVLGSVGLALLVYTVMSQLQKVESALNYIWNVKGTRSFEKRFSNYLSVLLVGPVLIVSAVGITGSLMSTSVVQKILSIKSLGTVIYAAGQVVPYLLVIAAFTFVYIFLPNTKVRFSAALTGGIFSGIAWKISGMLFASFIATSAKYSAIYSGFSILILFLIWLYWSWFILLVGGKVSFYQQYPAFIYAKKESLSLGNRMKEQLALMIMFLIGSHFHQNKPAWNLASLSRRIGLPGTLISSMLALLENKGLISPSGEEPPVYLPAKDPEIISIREILDVVRVSGDMSLDVKEGIPSVDGMITHMEKALYQSVENATLKSLIISAKKSGD
ncbi:MAG: YihY family inner membrane protein [Nitrospirota bacterium]|nr:YihY family inner membrane protein [Nitrospirota bacterium]